MPQVKIEATDPTMVKAEIDNFEGSYNKKEAKDLSIVNVSTQYGNGHKPYFQGNHANTYRG